MEKRKNRENRSFDGVFAEYQRNIEEKIVHFLMSPPMRRSGLKWRTGFLTGCRLRSPPMRRSGLKLIAEVMLDIESVKKTLNSKK